MILKLSRFEMKISMREMIMLILGIIWIGRRIIECF